MAKKKDSKQILRTTRMSTKGQVVIPEDIRKALGLKKSDELIITIKNDKIIMRKLSSRDILWKIYFTSSY